MSLIITNKFICNSFAGVFTQEMWYSLNVMKLERFILMTRKQSKKIISYIKANKTHYSITRGSVSVCLW